jgi:hypothetical protein
VSVDLTDALTPIRAANLEAIIDPAKVGEVHLTVGGFDGHLLTKWGLRLACLVFGPWKPSRSRVERVPSRSTQQGNSGSRMEKREERYLLLQRVVMLKELRLASSELCRCYVSHGPLLLTQG